MKTIIKNEATGATLEFDEQATISWPMYINKLKHIFFNRTTWNPELFEDVTNEGLSHVIKSFLTYQGYAPQIINSLENEEPKLDIECVINGVQLSIVVFCIPVDERVMISEYDNQRFRQIDGSIRFVADSADNWIVFYNMMFGS